MKLAHIRSGEIIRVYPDSNGRVLLKNGGTVSPPVAGYVNGNDRIVPVIEVTVDNSTSTQTTLATVDTVEADRLLRTVIISDMPIATIREGMSCSKMQGILTLGETAWAEVQTYRETASWAEKMVIDSAQDWNRTSENIAFFGYLLNYTDPQMDAMFIAAAQVTA
jgi:hypothetical protein